MKLFPLSAAFAATGLVVTAAFFVPASAQTPPPPASGSAGAAAPVLCAVKGEVLADVTKAAGKADYNGKTYYFCCKSCTAKFSKSDDAGKAKFAKLTNLRTEKIVLQQKMDTVNAELKALETVAPKAEAKPVATASSTAADKLYCAVTDEFIGTADLAAGGKAVYNGKTYYFCCAGCKPKFEANAAKIAAEADKNAAMRAASVQK